MPLDVTTTQWLITILVVPASAFAAAHFSNVAQGKKAQEIREFLERRMDLLEKQIDQVTGNLGKSIDVAKGDLTKSIDGVKGDLSKSIDELRADLKSVTASSTRVETTLNNLTTYLERLIDSQVNAAIARAKSQGASGD